VHTRSRLPSFVQREDKSKKNWSESWSRDLLAAVAVTSLQRGDETDVEAGTTTVRKGTVVGTVWRWQEESRGEGGGAATEEESRRVAINQEERRVELAGNAARCDEAGQVSPSKPGSCGTETPASHACRRHVEIICKGFLYGEMTGNPSGSPTAKVGLRPCLASRHGHRVVWYGDPNLHPVAWKMRGQVQSYGRYVSMVEKTYNRAFDGFSLILR
jgi:hypothetical protein